MQAAKKPDHDHSVMGKDQIGHPDGASSVRAVGEAMLTVQTGEATVSHQEGSGNHPLSRTEVAEPATIAAGRSANLERLRPEAPTSRQTSQRKATPRVGPSLAWSSVVSGGGREGESRGSFGTGRGVDLDRVAVGEAEAEEGASAGWGEEDGPEVDIKQRGRHPCQIYRRARNGRSWIRVTRLEKSRNQRSLDNKQVQM